MENFQITDENDRETGMEYAMYERENQMAAADTPTRIEKVKGTLDPILTKIFQPPVIFSSHDIVRTIEAHNDYRIYVNICNIIVLFY